MITKIFLNNFRNFKKRLFEFSDKTTVVVGDNASGKTNILEAIYLLSTGKSFKARKEEEMVSHDAEIARINGQVASLSARPAAKQVDKTDNRQYVVRENSPTANYQLSTTNLEAVLTRGEITIGSGNSTRVEGAPRKKLLVNGVSKRLYNFAGNLKAVLFAPQDLDLVTESPSIRRKFLDGVLSQIDLEYRRALLSYDKGLRQRNRLLIKIREGGAKRSQLLFWNRLLIKNGDFVARSREDFINYANKADQLSSVYYSLYYNKSAISEARLEKYANAEVLAGTTLVGPHRDDFVIKIINHKSPITNHRELARYGSRGEQRMGVLWLKMAERVFIENRTGVKPIFLLDDIFSELDHEHRDVVMDSVNSQQTIITTADPHFVEEFGHVDTTTLKS